MSKENELITFLNLADVVELKYFANDDRLEIFKMKEDVPEILFQGTLLPGPRIR